MDNIKTELSELRERLDKTNENTNLLYRSTIQIEKGTNRMITSVELLVKEVATLVERMKRIEIVEVIVEKEKEHRLENTKALALLEQKLNRIDKIVYGVISIITGSVGYMVLKSVGIQ